MALTLEQVEAIREAVRAWRRAPGLSGPPPDGQLEQIIEVMLGTSGRIGEVLAIRKVRCRRHRVAGHRPHLRHDHLPGREADLSAASPQVAEATRVVSVPSFTAEVLRETPGSPG